jgi:two-component system, chemotaxis family, chemotaxis protein CheY
MDFTTQLTGILDQTSGLTRLERAKACCRIAKQLEKAGEFRKAAEVLGEFWPDQNASPVLDGLDQGLKAEVLNRIGAIAGLLGSIEQTEGSQEVAKNLITQSVEIFETLGREAAVAEAQSDLALCYWREASYDEARVTLAAALGRVGDESGDLKAMLLVRAGIVELSTQRLHEALRLFNEAAPLLELSEDHTLKGSFHTEFGLIFRHLAAPENREDYLDRALMEYTAASFHFEKAKNGRYLAAVENNLGYLFFTIGRYQEAHNHLNRARQLFTEHRDVGAVAQVDDTRARTLLAEGRFSEAERVVRAAVRTLERGDERGPLNEALITQGIALARQGHHTRASALLARAVDVAESAGNYEGAGRARLSIIEELSEQNSPIELATIFKAAAEGLKRSQDPIITSQLIGCAGRVIDAFATDGEPSSDVDAALEGGWQNFSLRQELRNYERGLIARALREAKGSVTRAAKMLGFKHHQSLISLINSRHKELLKTRSAIRRRRQHLFSKPRVIKSRRAANRPLDAPTDISILQVEDNRLLGGTIADMLAEQDWQTKHCVDADNALRELTGNYHYDALLVDNDLPEMAGLDLVPRVRKITHRRRIPIVMLSATDHETEAWRAGIDAYLKKPDQIEEIPSAIARLLKVELKEK